MKNVSLQTQFSFVYSNELSLIFQSSTWFYNMN